MNASLERFTRTWPALPCMAFGLWNAWAALAFDGVVWMSQSQTTVTPVNKLYLISTACIAAVFLACGLLAARGRAEKLWGPRAALVAGVLASVASAIIVAVGPGYLRPYFEIEAIRGAFTVGCTLSGLATGLIGVRCAVLFGSISPRRSFSYLGLALLVQVAVYCTVKMLPDWGLWGMDPSFARHVAFCLLPCITGVLAALPLPLEYEAKTSGAVLQGGFWAFAAPGSTSPVVVFFAACAVVSCLVSIIGGVLLGGSQASTVPLRGDASTVFNLLLGVLFVCYAMREGVTGQSLGPTCAAAMMAVAAVMAVAAITLDCDVAAVLVRMANSLFGMLAWAILSIVSVQRSVSAVVVFGLGRGLYALGAVVGRLAGSMLLEHPAVIERPAPLFLAISAVTFALPCAFVARRWHRRLFECPKGSARPSLADLFQPQATPGAVEAPGGHPARPRFKDVVDGLAAEHSLAPRERDVFRCLAMGYGSDRVAEELGVSVSTVHSHTHNVYVKLGIHSRDELMRLVDARMG